jgi:hypothetical protein
METTATMGRGMEYTGDSCRTVQEVEYIADSYSSVQEVWNVQMIVTLQHRQYGIYR